MSVLGHPRGIEFDFPRDGVKAVGGFTARGVPMVVLVDMEREAAFHAQKFERKYRHLFSHRVS